MKILNSELYKNKYGAQAYARLAYVSIMEGSKEVCLENIQIINQTFSEEL